MANQNGYLLYIKLEHFLMEKRRGRLVGVFAKASSYFVVDCAIEHRQCASSVIPQQAFATREQFFRYCTEERKRSLQVWWRGGLPHCTDPSHTDLDELKEKHENLNFLLGLLTLADGTDTWSWTSANSCLTPPRNAPEDRRSLNFVSCLLDF
jgi:uncharacterized short protein YbdD (DUF466 family)